jgi:hypothetical protein
MTPASSLPVLDLACATVGREAAQKIGAGGVPFFSDLATLLHREGLYMVFVYLSSRSSKADAVAPKCVPIMRLFHDLLKNNLSGLSWTQHVTATSMVSDISTVFGDRLAELIQAKTILERCLDYASAHAKSYRKEEAPPKGNE